MSNSDSSDASIPPVVSQGKGKPAAIGNQPTVSKKSQAPLRAARPLTRSETWRDLAVVALLVAASDLLIYRFPGYTSTALVTAMFAAAIVTWKWNRVLRLPTLILMVATTLVALRLVVSGTPASVCVAVFLIVCLSMSSALRPVWFPEVFAMIPYGLVGAFERLIRFRFSDTTNRKRNANKKASSSDVTDTSEGAGNVLLPVSAVTLFSTLFVLANPNLRDRFGVWIKESWDVFETVSMSIDRLEVVFWCVIAIVSLGLLYPKRLPRLREVRKRLTPASVPAMASYRNTLVCVAVLFAAYLVFEFSTLWFREFPDDFYYAGYAHAGAFWLTVALAFATLLLSYFFRERTLTDSRVHRLKRLSWIWAVENLLLSLAVINRLTIYVRYNGLTQMRIVGYLGIAAVVAGFLLVVYKVYRDKGFVWLVHRQLWCPVVAAIALVILPVQWMANRYNVWEIERGNLRPAVQLVAHRYDTLGMLPIAGLADHPNEQVRAAAFALLAVWQEEHRTLVSRTRLDEEDVAYVPWESELGHRSPWTSEQQTSARRRRQRYALGIASELDKTKTPVESNLQTMADYQFADAWLRRAVRVHASDIEPFRRSKSRSAQAIDELFRFTYQWY